MSTQDTTRKSIIDLFTEKIKGRNLSVVLPEGRDPRIVEAARQIKDKGLAEPIVLGKSEKVEAAAKEAGVDLTGIKVIDPRDSDRLDDYAAMYADPSTIPDPELREAIAALSTDSITFIRAISAYGPSELESKELVRYIRSIEPKGPEMEAFTSGLTAGIMDSVDALYDRFPWAIALIVVAIYVTLLLLFRSVVLPAKAVLMNTMSIFASYGALVFIFQEGRLEGLLGIPATGQIEATIPILLFFILFGISMDYEVFLLTRIKEAYGRSGDNGEAVAEGLEKTGRIITSAALVVILVAIGFATGDLLLVKALAIGLAVGIALDVTIVRSLMVPALMRLLGNWNWWAPRFLREAESE